MSTAQPHRSGSFGGVLPPRRKTGEAARRHYSLAAGICFTGDWACFDVHSIAKVRETLCGSPWSPSFASCTSSCRVGNRQVHGTHGHAHTKARTLTTWPRGCVRGSREATTAVPSRPAWPASGADTMGRTFCGVEKLVTRQAHNLEYAGSSPAPATSVSEIPYLKEGSGRRFVPRCRVNGALMGVQSGVRRTGVAQTRGRRLMANSVRARTVGVEQRAGKLVQSDRMRFDPFQGQTCPPASFVF